MKDKYNMSKESNIAFAKRNMKDSIYRAANLEGILITFPQTEAILESASVSNVSAKNITKVFYLRNAWKYLLENIDKPLDLKFLEDLHIELAKEDVSWNELGVPRTQTVRISGTNYYPELPNFDDLYHKLLEFQNISCVTERAITIMLYLMRLQPFMDGNKRVASFVCNKILIENGKGLYSVPVEKLEEFGLLLTKYYTCGDMTEIKAWIYQNCIEGFNEI